MMSGLPPLYVPRVPVKQGHKNHAIAAPALERLKRAEPTVSPPAPSPRPAELGQPSAEAQARAIHLSRQKADGTISAADLKWLSNYRAPQRGELETPARRIEVEKLAKAICLVGKKVRGEISPDDARRLADHFAETKAIEFLR